jgi:hypothetical protein
LQFTKTWVTTLPILDTSGQFVGETRFPKLVDTLKIFDVAVVAPLAQESCLSIDGGAVREITLAVDGEVRLCYVLTALDRGVIFYGTVSEVGFPPSECTDHEEQRGEALADAQDTIGARRGSVGRAEGLTYSQL